MMPRMEWRAPSHYIQDFPAQMARVLSPGEPRGRTGCTASNDSSSQGGCVVEKSAVTLSQLGRDWIQGASCISPDLQVLFVRFGGRRCPPAATEGSAGWCPVLEKIGYLEKIGHIEPLQDLELVLSS